MQFVPAANVPNLNKNNLQQTKKVVDVLLDNVKSCYLPKPAPQLNMAITVLYELAEKRLTLLTKISELLLKNTDKENRGSVDIQMTRACNDYQESLAKLEKTNNNTDAKLLDRVAHYFLRLTLFYGEDSANWLIKNETELFKFKLSSISIFDKKDILVSLNEDVSVIDDENAEIMAAIKKDSTNISKFTNVNSKYFTIEREVYYKVPFVKVLDLIKFRQVHLIAGSAYIPEKELSSLLILFYKDILTKSYTSARRNFFANNLFKQDERLLNLFSKVKNFYEDQGYKSEKNETFELNLNEIDQVANSHFPPCMRNLHLYLRSQHHLKYHARLQYGLFLKGAGLSLDQQIAFWRGEFTKVMDSEKFNKNYVYNIRYNYGQEGRKSNFQPYSCMKILKTNEPATSADVHGCPFKHFDRANLHLLLNLRDKSSFSEFDIEDIDRLVDEKHYHLACTKYLELTHKNELQQSDLFKDEAGANSVAHPNQYFSLAMGLKKN